MPPSGNTSFGIGFFRRITTPGIRAKARTTAVSGAVLPAVGAHPVVEASAASAVAAASAAAVAAEDGSSLSATASYP